MPLHEVRPQGRQFIANWVPCAAAANCHQQHAEVEVEVRKRGGSVNGG
jgi:hypothetical protein